MLRDLSIQQLTPTKNLTTIPMSASPTSEDVTLVKKPLEKFHDKPPLGGQWGPIMDNQM